VIAHILFDLDNTLYPASTGFEDRTIGLMIEFAAEHLGLSLPETRALRAANYPKYGTTFEWLKREHGLIDAEGYFARVHPEGEESILSPDPVLRELLSSDPLPKSIFSNSPREHVDRVLKRLGLSGLFEAVYDIRFFEFRGKPAPEAYTRVSSLLGLPADSVAFFDDSPRAVRAFQEMGGHACLVDESGAHADSGLASLASIHHYRQVIDPKLSR
jgi:putative hydrolase of the HAD superfamily